MSFASEAGEADLFVETFNGVGLTFDVRLNGGDDFSHSTTKGPRNQVKVPLSLSGPVPHKGRRYESNAVTVLEEKKPLGGNTELS